MTYSKDKSVLVSPEAVKSRIPLKIPESRTVFGQIPDPGNIPQHLKKSALYFSL